MRLSALLALKYGISRAFAKKAIKDGRVRGAKGLALKDEESEGCDYELLLSKPHLVFETGSYLIKVAEPVLFFHKPPFMHTERLNPYDDALCLSDVADTFPDYRLITRLDYGVEGLVAALKKGLDIVSQEKIYLARLKGRFEAEGVSRWGIEADKRKKVKALPDDKGVPMSFTILERRKGDTLAEVRLEYAHRHQIRAVCAYLGHPIIGDPLYGEGREGERIMLFCKAMSINGERCEIAPTF